MLVEDDEESREREVWEQGQGAWHLVLTVRHYVGVVWAEAEGRLCCPSLLLTASWSENVGVVEQVGLPWACREPLAAL